MSAYGGDENDFIECDKDTKNKIKLKLMDINDAHNLTNIDCRFFEKKIEFNSIGYNEAKKRLDIFENISKLSVYIINDYDFFVSCGIQSAFIHPIYNTAMEKLGYQRNRSIWTLHSKPSQDVVIDNIFKFCLYSYIVQKKNENYNKPNSYQSFPKKSDSYNDDRRRTHNPMKKEHFENQREQQYNRKQDKSQYHEENYMQNKQRNEDTRNKINRENNKFDNVQMTRKHYDNQTNFDNYQPNNQNVERPPKNNDVSDKWKCKVCEMMNSFQRLCCEACDNKGPSFQEWSCRQCTYRNKPDSVNCEVCGATNPTRPI